MAMYYELSMSESDDEWVLTGMENYPDGTVVDIWSFNKCIAVDDNRHVPFHVELEGRRVDFNPTAFGACVVSQRLAKLIERMSPDGIQLVPAIVSNDPDSWAVLNILSCVNCIDFPRSSIQYFPSAHTRAGQIRGITSLCIQAQKVGENHIFHPTGWPFKTIVSKDMMQAMSTMQATGVQYIPVQTS